MSDRRFPALHVRDFRLFWLAQLISLSGTWMHSTAQGWLIYTITRSPLYLGLIATLGSLPILLFTLFGGLIADRYRKKDILLMTQSFSIIPALVIGVLSDTGVIQVWHVGLLAFVLGTINAIDIPVRQSYFAELVDKTVITNAIALNSMAFNGARITGPMIAGLVIEHLGITSCFYLNAVSFVPVLIALYMIKTSGTAQDRHPIDRDSIMKGLTFVRGHRPVLLILLLIAFLSLFAIPYINLLPVIAEEVFNRGIKGLTILMSSLGVGSFSGALIIASVRYFKRKDLFIPLSAVLFGTSLLVLSFSRDFYVTTVAMVLSGWGIVTCLALANGFIQEAVIDSLRGRVVSLYVLVFLGLAPIGNAIMGVTADLFGTMPALRFFAIFVMAIILIFVINFRRACEDPRH